VEGAELMRPWTGVAAMLGVLTLAGGVLAQTPPPPDAKTWVREHDKNGDGKIDREEFHQAVIEAFFLRDVNKDGFLTVEELVVITPEARNLLRSKPDGKMSLPEFLNALHKDFAAADTNDDGLLTAEEIEIYMRKGR
jgi:Ca2+-binding EF-hand superfamily protein